MKKGAEAPGCVSLPRFIDWRPCACCAFCSICCGWRGSAYGSVWPAPRGELAVGLHAVLGGLDAILAGLQTIGFSRGQLAGLDPLLDALLLVLFPFLDAWVVGYWASTGKQPKSRLPAITPAITTLDHFCMGKSS